MNKQIEALKLALEDLLMVWEDRPSITAILEALADHTEQPLEMVAEQPAQQEWPKPKFVRNVDGVPCITLVEHEHLMRSRPQPAQQQEPVITKNEKGLTLHVGWDDLPAGTKLYTSPQPRRPWVGLVHEETHEATGTAGTDLLALAKLWSDNKIHVYQFDNEARKIIEAVLRRASAKLREKNT